MHTAETLRAETFEYRADGGPVEGSAVMPSLSVADRLGVVMDDPTDGLGAGNFILSCVTSFYERLRDRCEEFFEYPDYYTFQASPDTVDYLEFDIWPDHKNVSVPRDAEEEVLRALNDRAVTVLLVGGTQGDPPDLRDVTRRSAKRRIDACYRYAPDGTLGDGAFSISLPQDAAAQWYQGTFDALEGRSADFGLPADGTTPITQEFTEISFKEALTYLPNES